MKFVRRDVKEHLYRVSKEFKELTTKDIGYSLSGNIFIYKSLVQANKEFFKRALQAKDKNLKFNWTATGKMYLTKDESNNAIQVRNMADLQKI